MYRLPNFTTGFTLAKICLQTPIMNLNLYIQVGGLLIRMYGNDIIKITLNKKYLTAIILELKFSIHFTMVTTSDVAERTMEKTSKFSVPMKPSNFLYKIYSY